MNQKEIEEALAIYDKDLPGGPIDTLVFADALIERYGAGAVLAQAYRELLKKKTLTIKLDNSYVGKNIIITGTDLAFGGDCLLSGQTLAFDSVSIGPIPESQVGRTLSVTGIVSNVHFAEDILKKENKE